MLGHKQPLSNAILGHKKPLGNLMLGHKKPLMDSSMPVSMEMEMAAEGAPKKSALERRINRGGMNLGVLNA